MSDVPLRRRRAAPRPRTGHRRSPGAAGPDTSFGPSRIGGPAHRARVAIACIGDRSSTGHPRARPASRRAADVRAGPTYVVQLGPSPATSRNTMCPKPREYTRNRVAARREIIGRRTPEARTSAIPRGPGIVAATSSASARGPVPTRVAFGDSPATSRPATIFAEATSRCSRSPRARVVEIARATGSSCIDAGPASRLRLHPSEPA